MHTVWPKFPAFIVPLHWNVAWYETFESLTFSCLPFLDKANTSVSSKTIVSISDKSSSRDNLVQEGRLHKVVASIESLWAGSDCAFKEKLRQPWCHVSDGYIYFRMPGICTNQISVLKLHYQFGITETLEILTRILCIWSASDAILAASSGLEESILHLKSPPIYKKVEIQSSLSEIIFPISRNLHAHVQIFVWCQSLRRCNLIFSKGLTKRDQIPGQRRNREGGWRVPS